MEEKKATNVVRRLGQRQRTMTAGRRSMPITPMDEVENDLNNFIRPKRKTKDDGDIDP